MSRTHPDELLEDMTNTAMGLMTTVQKSVTEAVIARAKLEKLANYGCPHCGKSIKEPDNEQR